MAKSKYQQISLDELKEIVKNSTSLSEVMRKLGYKSVTSQQSALKEYLDKNEIDYSHFKGHAWNKIDNPDIENEFSTSTRSVIKSILIKERGYQCERCKNIEWLGEPISLELHHIDGNPGHNIRNNLQLLCPNCHSLTENFRSKKRKREISDEEFIQALQQSHSINQALCILKVTANSNMYKRARNLMTQYNISFYK